MTMAALGVVAAERSAPAQAATLTITRDISYGPSRLDVYFSGAKKGALRPAIVMVHGGGWVGGDKTQQGPVTASKDMANAGFAVFNINYPVASDTVAGYPMEIQAIAKAVNWVKANSAKYWVDPNRIGLLGGSAGGNLVYMVGLLMNNSKPGAVRAVSGLSGLTQLWEAYLAAAADPTNPSFEQGLHNLQAYLGCVSTPCSQNTADAASPYSNVTPTCPATDIYNSSNESVPLEQVNNFANALTAAGCTVEVDIIPGTAHAFKYWSTAMPGLVDFFARTL
jgi:acetyl esterase